MRAECFGSGRTDRVVYRERAGLPGQCSRRERASGTLRVYRVQQSKRYQRMLSHPNPPDSFAYQQGYLWQALRKLWKPSVSFSLCFMQNKTSITHFLDYETWWKFSSHIKLSTFFNKHQLLGMCNWWNGNTRNLKNWKYSGNIIFHSFSNKTNYSSYRRRIKKCRACVPSP